jgi:plastocyanin
MTSRIRVRVSAALAVLFAARIAQAAPAANADVERLEKEVRELRTLVMQLMRVEKEHYDLLMNLVQQGRPLDAAPGAGAPPHAATDKAADKAADAALAHDAGDDAAAHAAARTGSIHGKVQFPGGSLQDVYVYVENVKSAPAHGKSVEIAQRGKQFVPQVIAVQRGTKVGFPNYDTVFHNVFSPTPPHPFDLGSYRAGEESKSVELTSPGVVDIYCNMHSSMHASILVVPSPLYARVASDGSFHFDAVPAGARTLVVWGPRSKPAKQSVQVGGTAADVNVTLESRPMTAHNNKFGQPYPSYDKN